MRYDGYYILSDLVEIPNLRARSTQHVLGLLKRALLGIPQDDRPPGWRLRGLLFTYGVAAAVYRVTLLLAIAAILVSKTLIAGLILACVYLGGTVVKLLSGLTRYLWYAEQTAPVRRRAIALSLVPLVLMPTGLLLLPVPAHVHARASLTREHETVVRAKTSGFLRRIDVESGDVISERSPLVLLENDIYQEDLAVAQANIRASDIRRDAYRIAEPDMALREVDRSRAFTHALEQAREKLADLQVVSPVAGTIAACVRETEVGSYVSQGEPVAMVASGTWLARAILTDDDVAGARPRIGDKVEFRAEAMPAQAFQGVLVKVSPAGSRTIALPTLTQLAGGDIAIDPQTGEARQPYFEVVVELPVAQADLFRPGMTGIVRLEARPEPIATRLARRFTRFINRLMQES